MDEPKRSRRATPKTLDAAALYEFVEIAGESLTEDEALEILANRFCTPQLCQKIAQNVRLTSYYTVRERLVAHRLTPRPQALKFVHYLYWNDLLRLSVDVLVAPAVRRALDLQLLNKLTQLTLGERITTARSCSREVAKSLLSDPDPKVFAALLNNPRLTEDDLIWSVTTERCGREQICLLADDRKWSHRTAIRKAIVLCKLTPRSVAASQLRHLSRADRAAMLAHPALSTFLRRCIERLEPRALEGPA